MSQLDQLKSGTQLAIGERVWVVFWSIAANCEKRLNPGRFKTTDDFARAAAGRANSSEVAHRCDLRSHLLNNAQSAFAA